MTDNFSFKSENIFSANPSLKRCLDACPDGLVVTHGSDAKRRKIQRTGVTSNAFRKIPVFPTYGEIMATIEPTIRPNVVIGRYEDVDQYLDIQYRLLREDLIRPLRRGIKEYRNSLFSQKSVNKIEGIWIYSRVFWYRKAKSWKFEDRCLKNIDWKESKRLQFGSLVCISSDNFRTFRFATISDNYRNDFFQMKIETQFMGKFKLTDYRLYSRYVMIESKAFFEAYRYTLKVLQTLNSDNFPLKRYIIEVKNEIPIPSYMTSELVYDLSHLIVSTETSNQYKNVKVMDSSQWPNAESMALDSSQYEAFKSALLQQLVLIQGPPGTGKSYIGLKIVETLYKNRYKNNVKVSPILIVCYTNHALDQFLEGMLPFCQNLIRIGGKSKSEKLRGFTIGSGRDRNMFEIMKKNIIGMTTTGAAKYRQIIDNIRPKIVVIEEAAEVLESHVITSLTGDIEHLILIGDHQQLRPKPSVYELAKTYNLDISLFERLINNNINHFQLKFQHRMRPEIKGLIVPHIYEELFDHKIVFQYEDIRGLNIHQKFALDFIFSNFSGIVKNMFFLNHSELESGNDETLSKSNRFEAEFVVRLAKHFILQDYESTKITILTMYSSQMFDIKRLLRRESFKVEVKCLDGYQGEENDIIIISFVRSNDSNSIGFLKVSNRVNVALSRAKKGLYCVGNFDCLSNKSDLWLKIKNYLIESEAIGRELGLQCYTHPNVIRFVSNVKDFDIKSPFGGCLQIIPEHKLVCGHSCPLTVCHIKHTFVKCAQRCPKILKCEHKCQQICHFNRECNPCPIYVMKECNKCLRNSVMKCSDEWCPQVKDKNRQYVCPMPFNHMYECGHSCPFFPCHTIHDQIKCQNICNKNYKCGHQCLDICHFGSPCKPCSRTVTKGCFRCKRYSLIQCSQQLCKQNNCVSPQHTLKCGHSCPMNPCLRKHRQRICMKKCNKTLSCGHQCPESCHLLSKPCKPCPITKQKRCHKCKRISSVKCEEQFKCPYQCPKLYACSHRCVELCSNYCPLQCLVCWKRS